MNTKKTTEKNKNLIYDVGINLGQDTDFYLKKGYKVIAFEASPDNVEVCKKRFADAIKSQQLILIEGAITEDKSQEKIKFIFNKDHALWGTTSEDFAHRSEIWGTTNEVIQVDAVDFEKCLEEYGIPFYLKADIVGNETICLRALLNFEQVPDYISIRSEKVIFKRLLEEFRLLEALGYNKYKAIQQSFGEVEAEINGKKIKYTFDEGASGPFAEETSGKWRTKDEVLKDYEKIFVKYWLFGDYSYLIQTNRGRKILAFLERIFRQPLPGWFDTHAKHSNL